MQIKISKLENIIINYLVVYYKTHYLLTTIIINYPVATLKLIRKAVMRVRNTSLNILIVYGNFRELQKKLPATILKLLYKDDALCETSV